MSLLKDFIKRISPVGKKLRDPYVFQIGFDFGTSFSKFVYRDLAKDKSFVFTDNTGEKTEFLFSSSILYRNGVFAMNPQNQQYPEDGLWHIKMAVAGVMQRERQTFVLEHFNKAAGLKQGSEAQRRFVKASCLFYLSRILRRVRNGIIADFSDFGKHEKDEMYVTMAIPVSTFDENTEKVFLDLLERAWALAIQKESLPPQATREEMEALLDMDFVSDGTCHVYPEVSANIHAFRSSPSAAVNSTRIYLFTDVGAGTVDQCSFTCTRKGEVDKNNYFSAQIFNLGSGIIEERCVKFKKGNRETWRYIKETKPNEKEIQSILSSVSKDLTNSTLGKTLPQIKERLYDGNGVTPLQSLHDNVYLVFSGGGDMDHPYHTGVINAMSDYIMNVDWRDRVISIGIPEDIQLPEGCKSWMKRLYVAYGLSLHYDDLPKNMFPDETVLKKGKHSKNVCPYCKGKNAQCVHCNGYGYED